MNWTDESVFEAPSRRFATDYVLRRRATYACSEVTRAETGSTASRFDRGDQFHQAGTLLMSVRE